MNSENWWWSPKIPTLFEERKNSSQSYYYQSLFFKTNVICSALKEGSVKPNPETDKSRQKGG